MRGDDGRRVMPEKRRLVPLTPAPAPSLCEGEHVAWSSSGPRSPEQEVLSPLGARPLDVDVM